MVLAAVIVCSFALSSQADTARMKMTTDIPPGIGVPDKIESSIGTLNLRYGYPEADTVRIGFLTPWKGREYS
jgi:hypothetical protein